MATIEKLAERMVAAAKHPTRARMEVAFKASEELQFAHGFNYADQAVAFFDAGGTDGAEFEDLMYELDEIASSL